MLEKIESAWYFMMVTDLSHVKSIMNIAYMLNKDESVTQDVRIYNISLPLHIHN